MGLSFNRKMERSDVGQIFCFMQPDMGSWIWKVLETFSTVFPRFSCLCLHVFDFKGIKCSTYSTFSTVHYLPLLILFDALYHYKVHSGSAKVSSELKQCPNNPWFMQLLFVHSIGANDWFTYLDDESVQYQLRMAPPPICPFYLYEAAPRNVHKQTEPPTPPYTHYTILHYTMLNCITLQYYKAIKGIILFEVSFCIWCTCLPPFLQSNVESPSWTTRSILVQIWSCGLIFFWSDSPFSPPRSSNQWQFWPWWCFQGRLLVRRQTTTHENHG